MSVLEIFIDEGAVRAQLVATRGIVWHGDASVARENGFAEAIDEALRGAPLRPRALLGPRVVVAVGPEYCRARRIEGLPATRHGAMLTSIVRQNPNAFFLRRSSRLAVSDIDRRADGSTWAAAFDGAVVDQVVAALRRRRLTRVMFVPSADHTLAWRPEPDPRHVAFAQRARLCAATLAFVLAAIGAIIAPGIRARRDAARASVRLAGRQSTHIEAARVQAELARVTSQLDRIDKFQAARGRMTMLLGSIAQAVPESTAVVTIRVDSVEGSLVALTPHAADVLPELAGIEGVVNPRIAGSVTRETQGLAHLERATIRFRRKP